MKDHVIFTPFESDAEAHQCDVDLEKLGDYSTLFDGVVFVKKIPSSNSNKCRYYNAHSFPARQNGEAGIVEVGGHYRMGFVARPKLGSKKPILVRRNYFLSKAEMDGKTRLGGRGVFRVVIQRCDHPKWGVFLVVNYFPTDEKNADESLRMGKISHYRGEVLEKIGVPGARGVYIYITPHEMFVPNRAKSA